MIRKVVNSFVSNTFYLQQNLLLLSLEEYGTYTQSILRMKPQMNEVNSAQVNHLFISIFLFHSGQTVNKVLWISLKWSLEHVQDLMFGRPWVIAGFCCIQPFDVHIWCKILCTVLLEIPTSLAMPSILNGAADSTQCLSSSSSGLYTNQILIDTAKSLSFSFWKSLDSTTLKWKQITGS